MARNLGTEPLGLESEYMGRAYQLRAFIYGAGCWRFEFTVCAILESLMIIFLLHINDCSSYLTRLAAFGILEAVLM